MLDQKLTSWARIALEAIPDRAAGLALRDAMDKTTGRTLIGVINSLGVRREEQAVDRLIPRIKDADEEVATAAIAALGRIGNNESTAALRQALTSSPDTLRSAVAAGCILCAENYMALGQADKAEELYDEVRAANVPRQRIVEATRGAILARGSDGVPLLVEQLKSSDKVMVSVGLMAARELSGLVVTKKLVAALGDLPANQQALLIVALADRGDVAAVPAMLKSAKSGPTEVRIAALDALKSLGDVSSVPVLLRVAAEDHAETSLAAKETLKALTDETVDADLVARLAHTQGAERLALLELVGMRRIDAVPLLLKAVDDDDAKVRSVALLAMGEVVQLDNVSTLIERVLHPQHSSDGPVALQALQAACVRMPEREACAEQLAVALAKAPAGAKGAILETLAAMGGKNALQTLQAAANSEDASLQDAATRLLGSWMTVDAGPVLLELATTSDNSYQVRALRGYIRLARQFLMPAPQRTEMCRLAWAAAERDAERKLVLQVVERYPSDGMLRVAVEATKHPTLGAEATQVAHAVAKKIGKQDELKALLKQVQQ